MEIMKTEAKSRTRYLKDTLGIDGLINAYTKSLKMLWRPNSLILKLRLMLSTKQAILL